jgi:hypothetical protein
MPYGNFLSLRLPYSRFFFVFESSQQRQEHTQSCKKISYDVIFTTLHQKLLIQRCTRVENPGEGVAQFVAKIWGGGKAFGENCQGGFSYFGFYCIFIFIKSFEIRLGGSYTYPPPSPSLCIYEFIFFLLHDSFARFSFYLSGK